MPTATTPQQSNPFVKQLASSDRTIRDRALSSLRTYLSRSTTFTPLDFLKLWKGLFFCMWMSDKPLNQQRLARDLADLVTVLKGDENFLGFVDAFWKTMAREWSGIDALRMDKYLYLVRCYVGKGFEVASQRGWKDEDFVKRYLEVLETTPLEPRDAKIPNGLRYHVIELYVDELDRVDTDRNAPIDTVLAPLRKLETESMTKVVRKRAAEALRDERLKDWQGVQAQDADAGSGGSDAEMIGADSDQEDEFGGFDE